MQQSIIFDEALIRQYDTSGPRYTSYPTAVQFNTEFTGAMYAHHASQSNQTNKPLSLYFHLPFCDTACYFCACSKVVTKDRSQTKNYLAHLFLEIATQAKLFANTRIVEQLHWGGGTPTFLNGEEMQSLMATTRQHFNLANDEIGEYSIEIDPRETNEHTVALLRKIGFNRMSLGIQDFDERVQTAVNRIQTESQTFGVLNAARSEGFRSVSVDLIYGLPFQTVSSFLKTLDKILKVLPNRLSVFNYAHLPTMFKVQRRISTEDIPSPADKLAILQATIQHLTDAGYVYIGMDHFARPDDELAIAQRNGTLYRNFQGYATHADCDMVAMGVTAIGKVGNTYSQNVKTLEEYFSSIENGNPIPIFRGVVLTDDDILRREIITQLMCNFVLNIKAIEQNYKIDFASYFPTEISVLVAMQQDGLLHYTNNSIEILPAGRLLVRNVCMVFDAYLKKDTATRYSKVI